MCLKILCYDVIVHCTCSIKRMYTAQVLVSRLSYMNIVISAVLHTSNICIKFLVYNYVQYMEFLVHICRRQGKCLEASRWCTGAFSGENLFALVEELEEKSYKN